MTAQTTGSSGSGSQFLLAAAAFVIVVAGLREASAIVLPFLVAVVFSVVSVPFMRWLLKLRVPQPLAVLSTVLAAAGVISLLVLLVVRSVNQFGIVAPRYQARLQQLMNSARELLEGLGVSTEEWQSLELLPVGVFDILGGALGAVATFASNSFLVLLTVVFILMEAAGFSRKVSAAFGTDTDLGQFERMTRQVQHYLVIKTAISAMTGTIIGLWVAFLGLDFPLLWGLIAFLFNFIPNLGSIFAAIPAVSLALIQFGPGRAAVIAIGYLAVNLIFGSFLEPTMMGRRLGALDARGLRVVGVLGVGPGPGRDVVLGSADDGGQDRAREHRGLPLDRGDARKESPGSEEVLIMDPRTRRPGSPGLPNCC